MNIGIWVWEVSQSIDDDELYWVFNGVMSFGIVSIAGYLKMWKCGLCGNAYFYSK